MAIDPSSTFPDNTLPATPSYPLGQARDVIDENDPFGTPYEALIVNDIWGFFQALLARANIAPSNNPDTAELSQYLQSIIGIIGFQGHNTVADMVADTSLIIGDRVITFDGKVEFYEIAASGIVLLDNGLFGSLFGVTRSYDPITDTTFWADKRDGSILNDGQELHYPVLNPSVSPIQDGQVVRITGWSGGLPSVVLALAGDLTSSSVIGIATTIIVGSSVQTGKITRSGEVRNLDTSLIATNSALYVDPITPGAFTTIKPLINAFIIGVIGVSDASGSVFVNTVQPPIDVSNAVPASGSRVFLTAEQTTGGDPAGADIFIASTEDPLTGNATTASPAVPDDSQAVLTEFLNDVRAVDQQFDSGAYNGSVVISIDNINAEERVFVEVYEALADGTVIDSGSGKVNGTQGQPPIIVLDSGAQNLQHTTITRTPIIGQSELDVIGAIGNRTKYVVVVAKVGSAGGDKIFTLHHGIDTQCFINIPKIIEMGDLDNVDETGIGDGDVLVRSGTGYIPGSAPNINASTLNNTLSSPNIQGQIDEADDKVEINIVDIANANDRIDNLVLSESTFSGGEFFLQSDDVIVNAEDFNSFTTSAPNDIEEQSTNPDTTPSQENLISRDLALNVRQGFISDPFDIEITFPEGNWSFNSFLKINNRQGVNELRIKVRKMTASPGFVKSDIATVSEVINFTANDTVQLHIVQQEIPEFTLLEGERLFVEYYAFSDNARTWTLLYDGSARQSKVGIPAAGFHNDSLGIQGGTVGDRQHLTTAELEKLQDIEEVTLSDDPTLNDSGVAASTVAISGLFAGFPVVFRGIISGSGFNLGSANLGPGASRKFIICLDAYTATTQMGLRVGDINGPVTSSVYRSSNILFSKDSSSSSSPALGSTNSQFLTEGDNTIVSLTIRNNSNVDVSAANVDMAMSVGNTGAMFLRTISLQSELGMAVSDDIFLYSHTGTINIIVYELS